MSGMNLFRILALPKAPTRSLLIVNIESNTSLVLFGENTMAQYTFDIRWNELQCTPFGFQL